MSDLEDQLRELVREAVEEAVSDALEGAELPSGDRPPPSWRERMWTCPSEARIGVEELAEALGRSSGWIYQRTRSDADNPIPHGKIGGALTFRCGEVRAWVRATESVEVAGPSDPPERSIRLHGEEEAA